MSNLSSLLHSLNEHEIPCLENQNLSEYSTMKVGGTSALLSPVRSSAELIVAVNEAQKADVRFIVIGNGSNILFSDSGFDGLVITTTEMRNFSVDGNEIKSDCGASITRLAVEAHKAGLTGLEFAYGIPGTLGGGVYMNAGAYGGSISDVLGSSICFDTETNTIRELSYEEHEFTYRHSIYTKNPNLIVLAAKLVLSPGNADEILSKMNTHMQSRKEKQPLNYPSAGSVFKRPVGYYAGELIENCGLKGYRVGGAEVSEKHAGFIINRGGATAEDVLKLVDHIQKTVYQTFSVQLECEIKYIR